MKIELYISRELIEKNVGLLPELEDRELRNMLARMATERSIDFGHLIGDYVKSEDAPLLRAVLLRKLDNSLTPSVVLPGEKEDECQNR